MRRTRAGDGGELRSGRTLDGRATSAPANLAAAATLPAAAILKLSRPVSGHVFDIAGAASRPGTRVVTIGFPFAGPKGLSSGVVSGLGRKIRTESGTLVDMVQTDTPINPGNSGGPFIDLTDFVLVDATANGSKADVDLDFRSQQAPGYGPKGAVDATCLRWELVYHVIETSGVWKIDSAKTVHKPGWTRC